MKVNECGSAVVYVVDVGERVGGLGNGARRIKVT
jgi:hypothetical protein